MQMLFTRRYPSLWISLNLPLYHIMAVRLSLICLFSFAAHVIGQSLNYTMEDDGIDFPPTCFEPGSFYKSIIDPNDCRRAAKGILFADTRMLDPSEWRVRSREHGVLNLPRTETYKSCIVTIDAEDPRILTFSTIRAIFFVSELIQECLVTRKVPLGGRVDLRVGTAYVGIIGSIPK